MVTRDVHWLALKRLMCTAQDHLIFSHIADLCLDDFCNLSDPDVGPTVVVCDVINTPFHFGLCSRKSVLCLFDECPCICNIYVIAGSMCTGVVHMSLQADQG